MSRSLPIDRVSLLVCNSTGTWDVDNTNRIADVVGKFSLVDARRAHGHSDHITDGLEFGADGYSPGLHAGPLSGTGKNEVGIA